MADAVSLARYLLNEDEDGQIPTTCADDEGDSDLTIEYGDGVNDLVWTSNGAGRGLDFLRTDAGRAAAVIDDMSAAGSIGGQLDGATEASFILDARVDNGDNSQHRGFFLGASDGDGQVAMTFGATQLQVRWNMANTGGYCKFDYVPDGSRDIFVVVFDTTAATSAGRARLWINKVEQTAVTATIPQNDTLVSQDALMSLCLGNRPSLTRQMDMAIFYAEIFKGQLTLQQISDSYDALILNNDVNWAVALLDILFLVPNASSIQVSDDELRDYLELAGHTVTMANETGLPSSADGKDVVLCSSYFNSGNVGTKLNDLASPVLSWENYALDDMGIGTVPGTVAGTDIDILEPTHPIAAGLTGAVTVYSASILVRYLTPVVGATTVASVAGVPGQGSIIVADVGDILSTGPAPARRVAFFLDDVGFSQLTTDGMTIFDAALVWATSGAPAASAVPGIDAVQLASML